MKVSHRRRYRSSYWIHAVLLLGILLVFVFFTIKLEDKGKVIDSQFSVIKSQKQTLNDLQETIDRQSDVLLVQRTKEKETDEKLETLNKELTKLKEQNKKLDEQRKLEEKKHIEEKKKLEAKAKEAPVVSRSQSASTPSPTMTVVATGYTYRCTGCSGITATGFNLKANPSARIIAVDPRVIPLGSKVYVEGYGYAIASDTGGAIKGNKIDLNFATTEQAVNWGRKKVGIRVIK